MADFGQSNFGQSILVCWCCVVGVVLLLVLLLFLTRAEASQQVHVHSSLKFIVQEPSMAKNSSPSRAPKNGAQLRENPEEREKRPQRPKNPIKPPGRHKHRHTARRNNVQIFSANRAWTSDEPSRRKYEILPKARGLTTAHRNNVQIFKCELPWHSMEAASGSESTFT